MIIDITPNYLNLRWVYGLLEGWALFGIFVLGILAVILLTSKAKVHPFLAMFTVSIIIGLVSGISPAKMTDVIISGFSSFMGYLAIIIVSATIIGELMEKTGATIVISKALLSLVGRNRSPIAVGLAGFIVSIPLICCDTAFLVLSPLARALSKGSGFSLRLYSLALAAGALVGFKLIFPSGPLFPATIFGADVIKVLILGTVAAIPALVVGLLFSYRFGRDNDAKESEGVLSFEELEKSYGKLPSLVASFSVLLVPIILIVARSVFDNLLDLSNSIRVVFDLIGHPVLALPIGIGIALLLAKDKPREEVNHWITGGIQRAAPILVIVGAAGIFGAVLQMTGIGSFLGNSIIAFGVPGVLVAFLVAALIKTMLGSSTVALVTAPAIILPILPSLGISPALAAIAVSAGTLICINVNDSFFWVVTGFGEMDVSTGYRTITLMSVLLGLTALVVIVLVAPLIGA